MKIWNFSPWYTCIELYELMLMIPVLQGLKESNEKIAFVFQPESWIVQSFHGLDFKIRKESGKNENVCFLLSLQCPEMKNPCRQDQEQQKHEKRHVKSVMALWEGI